MDWKPAGDEERAALKRIVALLWALADLAEMAGTKPLAVRTFVLWLLLAGEAVARNLVTLALAPCPFHDAGTSRADAIRLARRLRNLARLLDRQTSASAVRLDGIGDVEPAWAMLRRMLQPASALSLVGPLAFAAATRDALGAGIPDTS